MPAIIKQLVIYFALITTQSSAFACDLLAREFGINTNPSLLAIIYSAPPCANPAKTVCGSIINF